MRRVEMLHQHEGHPGIHWQMLKKLPERFEAASGRADSDYRERFVSGRRTLRTLSRRG